MAYIRVEYPLIQCFDDNGLLAVGYEIHTYNAGLTSLQTTYSDRTLTTPNLNPVVLNARGEAEIYTGVALKLVFTIPGGDPDNPIWTVDYVGEQQSYYLTGKATPVTAYNNYIVDVTPPPAALIDNMMLVWVPDIDSVDTIGATGHGGTGWKNDLTFSGKYTGSTEGSIFRVEISATGSPDTIRWRKDTGAWVTGIAITGLQQNLIEGLTFKFQELNGHQIGDYWTQTVHKPVTLNLSSLGAKTVYKNVGGTLVALDGGDLKAGISAVCVYSETNNCWELINTADPTLTTLEPSRPRLYLYDDFTLTVQYHGWELCFVHSSGEKTLTLCPAIDFYDQFVYVTNLSTSGTVNIVSDDINEKIYGSRTVDGDDNYRLSASSAIIVQLQTNGVYWHVLTETPMLITSTLLSTDYNLTADDNNKHIDFFNSSADQSLYLCPAEDFKNKHVYVSATGSKDIYIIAYGVEKIVGPRALTGDSHYQLFYDNKDAVMLHSDGDYWRILSETYRYVAPSLDPISLYQVIYGLPGTYTYTKSSAAQSLIVECYGGGGGGHACDGMNIGFPGAGGGYCCLFITDASSISSVTVTVGDGGSAGAYIGPATGGNGGTSSFGSYCSATGGEGGTGYTYPTIYNSVGGSGSAPGGSVFQGSYPSLSVNYNDVGDFVSIGFVSGGKGAGPLGGYGGPTGFNWYGENGMYFGGGGGNAVYFTGGGYFNGGAGSSGAVIVTEIR
jgi:hypothetical protein